jgi:uncharacterized protein YdhG (YjbR/CyaY superfamily)
MIEQSVTEYLQQVADDRHEILMSLHQQILRLYPGCLVDMQYKMPTYHLGDGWLALASQKHYISLYTCGAHHLEVFKQRHPGIKTGKGCINFNPRHDLPADDIEQVIRHAFEHPKG